jgi:hypothetical protein
MLRTLLDNIVLFVLGIMALVDLRLAARHELRPAKTLGNAAAARRRLPAAGR